MNHHFTVSRITLSFCLLFSGVLQAQRDGLNPQLGSTRQDSIPEGIMPLDTSVPMAYVLLQDPNKVMTLSDSFQWSDCKHYPLNFQDAHLGNYGSATRSLTPTSDIPIGFSTGWFQYDPYFLHEQSFKYYNQNIPVSKIKFSQASQDDNYITLDFGRSFAKGINFSVAYQRINQVGEFGHQRQKNTAFGVGVWHDAPSGKYDAYYNYISNAVVAEENGGIASPELIGDTLYPDFSVPVFLTQGMTNHKHRLFLTKQIFHLTGDSAQFGMDLWFQGRFSTGIYKYVDAGASLAAAYYGPRYLIDERGIRQYTYERENQWSGGISLPWRGGHSTFHAAIRYRSIALEQEPTRRKINELYLDVAGDFQWIDPLVLKGQLSYGLGQADGVFSFRAEGILKTGNFGHLSGNWSITSRKPYLVESTLFVNQEVVYQHAWKDPFVHDFGITYEMSRQQLKAGIQWMVFDNYIYFDSVPAPRQMEESVSLRRFFVEKAFDLKWAGVKGSVIWQPEAPGFLAIPDFLFTTGVFGKIRLFQKKLTLMPGVDVTYHQGFRGISYFPVSGTYHLTEGTVIPDYLRVDAGMGLQIQFLKVFVRMEDVAGAFQSRVLYQADYYPHYRGYFRLGLEASFFN